MDRLSKIKTKVQYDSEGNAIDHQFEWVGNSKKICVTFELLDDSYPELVKFPPSSELTIGSRGEIGPFLLEVTAIDYTQGVVYCKRLDGSSDND